MRKNDGHEMLPVRKVSKEYFQFRQYFIGPDLLYLLFDNISQKIFCFKTEIFHKIEHMLSARYKITEVPENDCNQRNSLKYVDKLLIS